MIYLELHELGNVEAEGEEVDHDDVEHDRRPPDADPERLADGEVALEADGERREDGAHLGDVRQAVDEGQRARVQVFHPGRRQRDRLRCKRKMENWIRMERAYSSRQVGASKESSSLRQREIFMCFITSSSIINYK